MHALTIVLVVAIDIAVGDGNGGAEDIVDQYMTQTQGPATYRRYIKRHPSFCCDLGGAIESGCRFDRANGVAISKAIVTA